jgi:hypothetical protein
LTGVPFLPTKPNIFPVVYRPQQTFFCCYRSKVSLACWQHFQTTIFQGLETALRNFGIQKEMLPSKKKKHIISCETVLNFCQCHHLEKWFFRQKFGHLGNVLSRKMF